MSFRDFREFWEIAEENGYPRADIESIGIDFVAQPQQVVVTLAASRGGGTFTFNLSTVLARILARSTTGSERQAWIDGLDAQSEWWAPHMRVG